MRKVLTPDGAGRELAKVLAVIARKREALRELTKERNGEIAKLDARARELMDIANGAPVQVELDTGDEADDLTPKPGEPCGACGVAWDEPSPGCEECEHPKPQAAKVIAEARKVAKRKNAPDNCACGVPVNEPNPNCYHHRMRQESSNANASKRKRKERARCADCSAPADRPGGALTSGEGLCWDCHVKRHPEQAPKATQMEGLAS